MSILPLTCATHGIDFFGTSVSVSDYSYTTDTERGIDERARTATRTITAAVDPSGGKRLERIFGASVSEGDIGLWTRAILYVADIYVAGSVPRQSILTYRGVLYRVMEVADWSDQAGCYVYRASRVVEQNGL